MLTLINSPIKSDIVVTGCGLRLFGSGCGGLKATALVPVVLCGGGTERHSLILQTERPESTAMEESLVGGHLHIISNNWTY